MPRRPRSPVRRIRPLWLLAVTFSAAAVLWLTLREDEAVTWSNLTGLNLVPLRHHLAAFRCWLRDCPAADAALEYLLIDVVGNVLLFVPLGLALAAASNLATRWGRLAAATAWAALLSLSIELIQLLMPSRASDVDDILFNSFGALLGALVGVLLFARRPRPAGRATSRKRP